MDRWIDCRVVKPDARARLFTFPYSGGGASMFRAWGTELGDDIEVCAVRLPGREVRIHEPAFVEVGLLVDALVPALRPRLDRPFAVFGHSLGAVIAFELARRLIAAGGPAPAILFVSARAGPQLAPRHPPIHALPQAEFLAQMNARYRAIPAAVLEEPELLDLLVPTLRADVTMSERHRYTSARSLPLPIAAYAGKGDAMLTPDDVAAWGALTSERFTMELIDGGHFFLNDAEGRAALLSSIRRQMAEL